VFVLPRDFTVYCGTLEAIATISQALARATETLRATSNTPRLDAELLLAHVLGWGRARLLAERRWPLTPEQAAEFRALVARRAELEPVAYLVGHKEFYGLDFVVDWRVLVPRPETELLVDLALAAVAARPTTKDERPGETEQSSSVFGPSSFIVADVGTGSGCIGVALAVHLPRAQIVAVDISPDALEVARQNVARHGVADRVRLIQGDLLAPIAPALDLIVGNPPYTILAEIDEGVRRHEPRGALDGGADGLDVYRQLLAQAAEKLRPGGAVLLEIGATQGRAVFELARRRFPGAQISIHKDLAGLDRVVTIDDKLAG
jgi:release factor glutamine methyltransferase